MVHFGKGLGEGEIQAAMEQGLIRAVHVQEDAGEFIVWLRIATPAGEEDLTWVTRRNRLQPRRFKDLQRLCKLFMQKFPRITDFHVHLTPSS